VKKYLFLLLLCIFTGGFYQNSAVAQSVKLVAENTLNGAMNGVVLGGATMALQNSDEFGPVRIGLGAGTLYGIGVGINDITQTQKGQQFYISGTFNDGTNTSVIVLLDTFYGAAGGVLIASSVSLIIQEPLVNALQYGAGTGAWIGFGFGIVDAFILSDGPNYSAQAQDLNQADVQGLLTYRNASKSVEIGMLNPKLIKQKELTDQTMRTSYSTALNVVELKVNL
jgi:hypothetical protein